MGCNCSCKCSGIKDAVAKAIRDVPDFPKPGIIFKDITPLLHDPCVFESVICDLRERYAGKGIDIVAGIESRGFLFGAPLALALNVPFVPIRKKGKLPYKTVEKSYELEYGQATIEMHTDAINADWFCVGVFALRDIALFLGRPLFVSRNILAKRQFFKHRLF